ncbi:MAG: fasciclin domain-containing protein [bacterium]|nr:fasciclin domain-containing protein [bacterium]
MKQVKTKVKYLISTLLIMAVVCPSLLVGASSKQTATNDPGTKNPTATEAPKSASEENIVTIASNDQRFNTLVAALKAAGLVDALEGEGPFTVFAPTNDAFTKLPSGTLEELLKPENKQKLEDVLTYHVFAGNVPSSAAEKLAGKEITMLNNKKAKITMKNGALYINNAKIVTKDIKAQNGVIHVIDNVLIPES